MTKSDQFLLSDYMIHLQEAERAMQCVQDYSAGNVSTIEAVADATTLNELPYVYRALAGISLVGFLTTNSLDDVRAKNTHFVAGLSARLEDVESISNLLYVDSLTGGLNRVGLNHWAETNYRPAERTYGVLYIDLTKFKGINDTLGHAVGDRALLKAYEKVASLTRVQKTAVSSDYTEDDRKHDTTDVLCSARVGGDELIAVMDFNGLNRLEAEEALLRVKKGLSTALIEMTSDDGVLSASFGFRVGTHLTGPFEKYLPFDQAVRIADMRCNDQRTAEDR